MNHEDFFRRFGDWSPQMVHGYGTATRFTTEHMYQAFKARMMAELFATAGGHLIEMPEEKKNDQS